MGKQFMLKVSSAEKELKDGPCPRSFTEFGDLPQVAGGVTKVGRARKPAPPGTGATVNVTKTSLPGAATARAIVQNPNAGLPALLQLAASLLQDALHALDGLRHTFNPADPTAHLGELKAAQEGLRVAHATGQMLRTVAKAEKARLKWEARNDAARNAR